MMCKKRTLKISMAALIVLSLIYNPSVSYVNTEKIYSDEIESTKNTLIDLSLWLQHNTPQASQIALHDIGVVGYLSDMRILDLVGLTNLEVSKYYWDENMKKPLPVKERRVIDYLKEKKPDYLVMFPEWDRFFNLFQSGNEKYFKHVYTSNLLYPTELKYKVYKCDWSPSL